MNCADFLNPDSDAVIFGYTGILYDLNARGPPQLYFVLR